MLATLTPQEEEREARRRQRQMARARRARDDHHAHEVWAKVREYRKRSGSHCRCDLHRGMTWDELLELGGGCTSPDYICPVLDAYRRFIGGPPKRKAES